MEKDILDTILYKDCAIKIYQDEDTQNPDEWGDNNLFLVGFHRDFTVENILVSEDICRAVLEGDIKKRDDDDDYIRESAKELTKQYHVFGLEAYIHGGVALSLSREGNFPDRRWDVSQLGAVFVSKKETKSRVKARKLALGLIETWNDYLSGNVYGFITETKIGNDVGSCWGFYGDYNKSGMIEEAKGEIDSYVEEKLKKHARQLKVQILKGVSLNNRKALAI